MEAGDAALYKAILDALDLGVAFAVPVVSASSKHQRERRVNSSGRSRAKDFRFVYVNDKLGDMARLDGELEDVDGSLTLQPGTTLKELVRAARKKRDEAKEAEGRGTTEMDGKLQKKKKHHKAKRGLFTRLLKAHKHAWRTGEEVILPPTTSAKPGPQPHVKLLKLGTETVGVLTLFSTGCDAPSDDANQKQEEDQQDKEQQLNQARELERKRARLIADMSHEIRTPMNGLIGTVSLLADDDQLTTMQRECVDTMYASAQHLLMLINDVLDYSKISMTNADGSASPTLKITSAPINLCAVVHDCVAAYGSQARDQGIDVIIRIAPGIVRHPFYLGDPLRLRQVLANLASNAIKFTKEGYVLIDVDYGRVRRRSTVEYGADESDQADQQREIVFRVIDTGLGIKREDAEKVFLPYVQEESAETEGFGGGTGLGLSIARQIATLMGGSLELELTHRRGRRRSIDPTSAIHRGFSAVRSSLKLNPSSAEGECTHSGGASSMASSSGALHSLYPCPSPLYEPFGRTSGSTFTLRLPMTKMDPAAAAAASASLLATAAGLNSPAYDAPTLHMSSSSTSPTIPMRVLLVGLPMILAATISDLLTAFGAKSKLVTEEEAKRILCRPLLQGKAPKDGNRWDVVAVYKGLTEGYMELAKRIRKEEKVKLLLLAYTSDQIDTKSLEDSGWDAYLGLPVQPVLLLQMLGRLRDEINAKAQKRVARRMLLNNEQDEIDRARKEWHQHSKHSSSTSSSGGGGGSPPKRERVTGIRSVLRRGWTSYSDSSAEKLPPRERHVQVETKGCDRQANRKSKLLTKYAFTSTRAKPPVNSAYSDLSALVVDDNAINRKVAVRMLESIGFKRSKITHAHDGREALEKAREKTFDVVLMDCFMPGMNGWDTAERLRAEGHQGLIIATTGAASSSDVARCLGSGMEACLQKPLVLDVFRETIDRALMARFAQTASANSSSSSSSSSSGSSADCYTPSPEPGSPMLPTSASAPSAISVPQTFKERNRSL